MRLPWLVRRSIFPLFSCLASKVLALVEVEIRVGVQGCVKVQGGGNSTALLWPRLQSWWVKKANLAG